MPSKRTRTSYMRAPGVGKVPAICISKPGGENCMITVYNCDGTFAGSSNTPNINQAACYALAQSRPNCKTKVIYSNTKTHIYSIQYFDQCGPNCSAQIAFDLAGGGYAGEDANYEYWYSSASTACSVYLTGNIYVATCDIIAVVIWANPKTTAPPYSEVWTDSNPGPVATFPYIIQGFYCLPPV